MRHLIAGLAGLLAVSSLACAPMSTGSAYYGFSFGVTSEPAPVAVVTDPHLVLVPDTRVYVVENSSYDMFRYGTAYYLCSGDYWYRARSSSGPFVAIDVRSVPGPVLKVPPGHWKHHPKWEHHPHGGPPGHERS